MKIHRIDDIGVVVNDFSAAKEFFLELGLEIQSEGLVEGEWVERIVGLNKVKAIIAMLRTPGGNTNFHVTSI